MHNYYSGILLAKKFSERKKYMFKIQKGYNTVSKTFRLPIELVDDLNELSFKYNLSLNQLVVQCLNYALENLDENDVEKAKHKDIL